MAQTTTLTICPSCGYFVALPAKSCPICSHALEKADQEGTAIEAAMESPPPKEATVQAILSTSEKAARISGSEIGHALLNFLIATGVGVGIFFFGLWVIRGFRGPGVLFFGYGGVICSPIIVIYGFIQLFSGLFGSRRGKTPKAAFEKVWSSGYFNGLSMTDSDATAAARVYRSQPNIPGARSATELAEYVKSLKQWIEAMLDAEEAQLATGARWRNGAEADITKWSVSSDTPGIIAGSITANALAPNVQAVSGVLRVARKRSQRVNDNKTNELIRCSLRLSITCYCVRRGKYWLLTDVTPQIPALPEMAVREAIANAGAGMAVAD